MRRHARWLLAAGTLLLLTTVLYAQQTGIPSRLLVKTDANNYLLTSSVAYTGPDSARQNFQNIRLRTDANGYLLTTFGTGGSAVLPFGAGTATYVPSGRLTSNTTPASNVTTGETDLMTYSLPAASLSATGMAVRISFAATQAANANTKTIRLYFGATLIATLASAANNRPFDGMATVVRTGATTQVSTARFSDNNLSFGVTNAAPTETLSGAVVIKVTGQSSAASGDVTATLLLVEALP